MLRALLHSLEPGRICDIVQPGQEFEVHTNFSWVDVPDGTTTADTYNSDGTITKFDPVSAPGFAENAYKVARGIAYGSINDQLDMMWHEMNTTGSISTSGTWFQHVAGVKSNIPKDNPQAVYEWNLQQLANYQANISGNTSGNISSNVAPA
jgi:hypothetical protein